MVSDTGLCAQQGLVMARGSIPLVCEGSSHLVWFPCALQAISNKNGHVHCPSKEHRQICFAQPAMSFINESVHVDAYDLWGVHEASTHAQVIVPPPQHVSQACNAICVVGWVQLQCERLEPITVIMNTHAIIFHQSALPVAAKKRWCNPLQQHACELR